MRLVFLIWLGIVWGGVGMAAPLPAPPEDFTADQFIAADGCAYLRAGHEWVPQLDGEDQPFCGFPPSVMPEGATIRQDSRPPTERLSDLLQAGLRAGERVSDQSPPESRSAPLPVPPEPELAALFGANGLAMMRRMQVQLYAGPQRVETCARLGYSPRAQTRLGTDVTGGLCSDQALAGMPAKHVRQDMRPVPRPLTRPDPRPAGLRRAKMAGSLPASGGGKLPTAGKSADDRLIGYVETGEIVRDPGQTAKLVRRLQALGLRAGRVPATPFPGHRIMAGPFHDRQAMITALDQLRRNGFSRARLPSAVKAGAR